MNNPKLYRSAGLAALHNGVWVAALGLVLCAGFPSRPAMAVPACVDRGARAPEARCESLEFGGRERTYRLYAPAQLASPTPLLVVLHGGGGGGAGMESLTGHGFNRRADEAGALVVYPDGIGHGWNDGRQDLESRATREQVDDVGFLRALVAALDHRYALDPARIGVVGISNGGMMTLRLACEAADVFTGFVAVAASLGEDLARSCRPNRVRPVALIDGTDDPIVPFGGGEVHLLGTHRGRVIGAEATIDVLRRLAGCTGEQRSAPLDRIADDGTTLVLRRATGCTDAAVIALYVVAGGGHAWPGGFRYAREWLIGRVSRELDATEEAWRFLGLATAAPGPR